MGRTMKISKEDYLETILVCTNKLGACRVTDIAAHLGHSKASVSVALSKLENEGLIRKISTALMKRIKANYRFILGFNSALIAGGLFGVMNPASSALLHNGSTILTGLKSMTNLLPDTKTI